MINHEATHLVSTPPRPKREVPVLNIGAHRGAAENMPAYAEFNASSAIAAITPVYTDPIPGRALAMKDRAERMGLRAGAIEAKGEVIVQAVAGASHDPMTLNLDRASAIAIILRATQGTNRPVLGYLLVKSPGGRLWGLRYVLEPGDTAAKEAAITFFETLAAVSERNASEAIFGERADPVHTLLEPAIRKWFAEHTKANLAKVLAGLEPTSNVFEITSDGQETLPLFVVVRKDNADPVALAGDVVKNPVFPIRRGTRFVVAEVNPPESVRFHEVRRRTDDRVSVGGVEVIDRGAFEAQKLAYREAIEQQTSRALARAERETLSRRNPIRTTD